MAQNKRRALKYASVVAALVLVGALGASAFQQPSVTELFATGEAALRAGNLDQAEAAFEHVLEQDSNSAGAYANLGVIAMRRQRWTQALDLLNKAERLAPNVAGIRLNIGLVYYRQNEFQSAIMPFESVCARPAEFAAGAVSSRSLLLLHRALR